MLDRPTLLDAAMGTALIARGLPQGVPPEAWLRDRPEEIARVHAAHAAAGARVLLTCTFGCASARVEAALGAAAIGSLCASAVGLARGAAPPGVRVAGALGPTGLVAPRAPAAPTSAAPPTSAPPPTSTRTPTRTRMPTPTRGAPPAPSRGALEARYAVPVRALAAAGADLLWIESQWDLDEARAALAAARASGLPTVVTFAFAETGGRLHAPGGSTAEECLSAVASHGALAAGVNCVFPGPALAALAAWAKARLRVPFVAKPSPGLPGAVASPEAFGEALRPAFAAGLRIAGACCGATADHLRALAPLVSRA
ncbi:MAG TPA: homocysteine S-methyltransferase family protein [Anaeromyxobacter sp.]|nr:homocysteine S-methyltransferase family protein [Anaeromyxobacter sp.]